MMKFAKTPSICVGVLSLLGAGCGGDDDDLAPVNERPAFIAGDIVQTEYDGTTDDLLTAGLGKTGIGGAAPAYAVPAEPTVAELRRNAIYTNYRALIDYTAAGGYGSAYGPNIDLSGGNTLGEGKIAGTESIAVVDDGSGRQNVVLMVQVPASFDKENPCIVTATSSGSRGIYGAIGTAGDWGLKRGCAVAYADKGSGNGLHDLMTDAVLKIDGTLAAAADAGTQAHFRAELGDDERAAFNLAFPNRVAYKHAHSQQNPEKDWGKNTLQAVKFAFYVLNQQYGDEVYGDPEKRRVKFTPGKTLVIASSVSNGGGAALAAAEQDREGLIDGVAVTEPNAQPGDNAALTIQQGATTVATHSKPLADYFSFANIYQPCAVLSAQAGLSLSPVFWPAAYTTAAQNRCAALAARGLITGATLTEQADAALAQLHAYGWQAESDFLHQSHFRFATNSIVTTYVNALGRFKVTDNVCGYSFANTDPTGAVVAQNPVAQVSLFASGNGVPPTTGVNVVYNNSVGGARLDFLAVSPTSGVADFALDGALCMRSLVTGVDAVTGQALFGVMKTQSDQVVAGIQEVQLGAQLRGLPAVIVAGRNDTLIPVNHNARAYFGKNQIVDGATSKARYYEVTNAQHFETFIAFGALLGYDSRYVPLHVYFVQAMNLMWAHLKDGTALPASQVVRTVPRAGAAPLTPANVPPIAAAPAAADAIGFASSTLTVPD
ncbi:MAG TPA: D-(-)-3-hydroxybutyrate oligomer hydrolase [Rubrivivax sp.]